MKRGGSRAILALQAVKVHVYCLAWQSSTSLPSAWITAAGAPQHHGVPRPSRALKKAWIFENRRLYDVLTVVQSHLSLAPLTSG